ncbi:divergent polysaccharide deacetylase family protein [Permianibacter sp. IMCC34836]|uniref:divergent polysaccharide deacetylase family protein n=1 Tax=Permianibacter fluminis TaxID=2738515 RepID=UPI00155791AC|nr:divergent polysaccharide deacetylase family protein [Permianibacter fluminis]NQD36202.1 divergent polysaccharide deacetylase family protein [Permianibacter fluminis]
MRRLKSPRWRWLCCLLMLPTLALAQNPRIAILIDDMGNNRALDERALALPGAVSYAFLPYTSFAPSLARAAHARGRDVLLHAPMESEEKLQLMGPGALTMAMSEPDLRAQLRKNLASIPFVSGFNNHMGSVLTRDPTRMSWLLDEAKTQAVFFIDSRTTSHSIAGTTARRLGVPSIGRDVFLDHDDNPAAIARQFDYLLKLARQRGHALAIGHPRPATLQVLEQRLATLADAGIVLVPVSGLLQRVVVEPCQTDPASSWSHLLLAGQRWLSCQQTTAKP